MFLQGQGHYQVLATIDQKPARRKIRRSHQVLNLTGCYSIWSQGVFQQWRRDSGVQWSLFEWYVSNDVDAVILGVGNVEGVHEECNGNATLKNSNAATNVCIKTTDV